MNTRSDLLRHSGGELARALAEQCLGVFGAVEPTEEHFDRLADHLLAEAARWADREFELGLVLADYDIHFFRIPLFGSWSWRITTPDGRTLGPVLTIGWADRSNAEEAALRRCELDSGRESVTASELRRRRA